MWKMKKLVIATILVLKQFRLFLIFSLSAVIYLIGSISVI